MNKKLGFSILSILVATIMLAGLTLPVGAKLGRTIFSNIVNNTATTMDDVDEVDDDVNEYELTGTVDVISVESWIIGGVTFQVTAETEIEDLITVGDIVKVDAFSDGQGGYIASEIELVDDDVDDIDDIDDVDEDENEIEMTGTVEAISAESWTISGVTFLVTADTEIEDLIAVGDNVTVEAISDSQGGYIASEIELVDDDMEDTDLDDDDDSDVDDDDGSDDEDDSGSDDGDDVEEDD